MIVQAKVTVVIVDELRYVVATAAGPARVIPIVELREHAGSEEVRLIVQARRRKRCKNIPHIRDIVVAAAARIDGEQPPR